MVRTDLTCPNERVFIYDRTLGDIPVLPEKNRQGFGHRTSNLEVDVLGIFGEKAIVLLPDILTRSKQTALVDIEYLAI